MEKLKITMPGAGSGFVLNIAQELLKDPLFAECEFMLYDPDPVRLGAAEEAVKEFFERRTVISLSSSFRGNLQMPSASRRAFSTLPLMEMVNFFVSSASP